MQIASISLRDILIVFVYFLFFMLCILSFEMLSAAAVAAAEGQKRAYNTVWGVFLPYNTSGDFPIN